MEIIPSILVNTKKEFELKLAQVESLVDRVHLDIADGIFVPSTTIQGYSELADLDTSVSIGVHLMVSKPENHVANWINTIADQVIFHIEATDDPEEVIDMLKEGDISVGIALNPSSPTDELEKYIDDIDLVHFMSVEPGFYGGEFVPDVIEKIKDFHFMYPDVQLQVDGGVTSDNIAQLKEVGITLFIVGSYIFDNKKLRVKESIEELRKAIKQ